MTSKLPFSLLVFVYVLMLMHGRKPQGYRQWKTTQGKERNYGNSSRFFIYKDKGVPEAVDRGPTRTTYGY